MPEPEKSAREIADEWQWRAIKARLRKYPLQCVECDALDQGLARGWTMRFDVDDELATFCPECNAREFGDD